MTATFALARLAARTVWKNKLRSLLVFSLIAVLVAAGTMIAMIVRSNTATDNDRVASVFGQTDLLIEFGSHARGEIPTGGLQHKVPGSGGELTGDPDEETDLVAPEWLTSFDVDRYAASLQSDYGDAPLISRAYVPPRLSQAAANSSVGPLDFPPQLLVDLDISNPLAKGIFEVVEGRVAGAPTEIVLATNSARDDALGSEIELWGARFLVVGLAVQPAEGGYSTNPAVVTPEGFDRAVDAGAWITHQLRIDRVTERPAPVSLEPAPAGALSVAFGAFERGDSHRVAYSTTEFEQLASSILTLAFAIQIALVAASAFAVGVRRRVVEFGQLMTGGAGTGHVRRLVLFEAFVLGCSGAVFGAAVGAGLAWWLVGSGQVIDVGTFASTAVRWHPIDLAGAAAVGIVAASLGAWWPARMISRVDPTTALAGRIPTKAPRVGIPLFGIIASAAGLFGIVEFSGASLGRSFTGVDWGFSGNQVFIVTVVLGFVVLTFVGFLSLIGTLIAVFGRLANRLPLLGRLVLRNSDRHRSRAWASVAAFVAALAMPVAFAAAFQAYPASFGLADATSGPSPLVIRSLPIAIAATYAALVALIGAALAAVELDRDIGAMIAAGAPSSIRRRLLGAQTLYHLLLAAVLALPLAVLGYWAAARADSNGPEGITLPWSTMGIVGIVIPFAVGLAIALIFRSGKPAVSRRLT